MGEVTTQRGIGSFIAAVLCGIAGFALAVGGILQLVVGLYNLAYPSAWQVSLDPADNELGPPAIATPDTVWMSPIASNAQNLLVVSLASVAGVCLLVAAKLWLRSTVRPAVAFTFVGATVAVIFAIRLFAA